MTKKEGSFSDYDLISCLNYLPTFNVTVFEYKNIKPSLKHLNCEIVQLFYNSDILLNCVHIQKPKR